MMEEKLLFRRTDEHRKKKYDKIKAITKKDQSLEGNKRKISSSGIRPPLDIPETVGQLSPLHVPNPVVSRPPLPAP